MNDNVAYILRASEALGYDGDLKIRRSEENDWYAEIDYVSKYGMSPEGAVDALANHLKTLVIEAKQRLMRME